MRAIGFGRAARWSTAHARLTPHYDMKQSDGPLDARAVGGFGGDPVGQCPGEGLAIYVESTRRPEVVSAMFAILRVWSQLAICAMPFGRAMIAALHASTYDTMLLE